MCFSLYSPPKYTCSMIMSSGDIVCIKLIANVPLHIHVHVHISNMRLWYMYMQLKLFHVHVHGGKYDVIVIVLT